MRIPDDRPSIDVTPLYSIADLHEKMKSGEIETRKMIVCFYDYEEDDEDGEEIEKPHIVVSGMGYDTAYMLLVRAQYMLMDWSPPGGELG